MPEHYTKATVSASFWCGRCGKRTLHRVDNGRGGPCYTCMAALDIEHERRKDAPQQASLFSSADVDAWKTSGNESGPRK